MWALCRKQVSEPAEIIPKMNKVKTAFCYGISRQQIQRRGAEWLMSVGRLPVVWKSVCVYDDDDHVWPFGATARFKQMGLRLNDAMTCNGILTSN
eukprot:scaffold344011_cov43-Prasinocladus_malaysianus.AAC.1